MESFAGSRLLQKNKNIKILIFILTLILTFIFIVTICLFVYGYYSGSCKINKKYICNNNFCLYKEFDIILEKNIKNDIDKILANKDLSKKVVIKTYPENIFNCALPNKSGITISTSSIVNNSAAPSRASPGCGDTGLTEGSESLRKTPSTIINFYQNDLCKIISKLTNLKLYPTDLSYPTSCALLIYNEENDWINWHYDYNYYNGRFFTVLIPITHIETCTKFQFMDDTNKITNIDLINKGLCFEGNYLYHRATKLCKNQKRVILSCQYVTDNSMNLVNKLRIKLKDYAYIGKIF